MAATATATTKKKGRKLGGIPFDVTREILLRLPARSVVRFRSACKLWRSATVEPNFFEAHLDLARKVSPPSILLAPTYLTPICCEKDYNFTVVRGDTWTPKLLFSMRGYRDVRFHGSCNGIICISTDADADGRSIQLMNPATGDSLPLPKTPHTLSSHSVLFGFHPATKEYKVSVVYDIITRKPGCLVYTTGTDSSWRDIDIDVVPGFRPSDFTLLNGVIFSLSNAFPEPHSIVSFDLKDESFKQFPLIDFGEEYDRGTIRIVELQGSVCIIFNLVDSRMLVWRLSTDDSGGIDKHGWTLLYTISPWDGMYPEDALFIHQDKILTMSELYLKVEVEDDTLFTMVCYRYVKKGNFGVNKILYMHQGCYAAHAHVESLVALPNQ